MNAFRRILASPAVRLAVVFPLAALLLASVRIAAAAEDAAGAATTTTGAVAASERPFAEYLLHVGDRIQLWVWGEPSLTIEVVVMPDGTVSLPLVGSLDVLGKSVPVVTKEVEEACGLYLKDPRVSLSCIPQAPLHVYVEGSVSAPGPVPYDPRFRLLDYLGQAGGPTPGADLSNVVVTSVRGARVGTTTLDLSAPSRTEAAPENDAPNPPDPVGTVNPVLSPGDTVWVGRAVPVAIIGAVRNPGAIEYRKGLRLSDYLGLAGGPTVRADLGKALLKHTEDGVTTSQQVNIAATLTDPEALQSDPILAPGDVLTVPERFLAEGITWSDILRVLTTITVWGDLW